MKLFKLTLLIYALFLNNLLEAAVLGIPSQYQDIQSAHNAAQSGDTIEIELPGTYLASKGFYIHNLSKDIEIKARWPHTVIDLEGTIKFIISTSINKDHCVTLRNICLQNYTNQSAGAIIEIEKGKLNLINCHLKLLSPPGSYNSINSLIVTDRITCVHHLYIQDSIVENCAGTLFCTELFIDSSKFKDNINPRPDNSQPTGSIIEFGGGVISNSDFSNSNVTRIGGNSPINNILITNNTFRNYSQNYILRYHTSLVQNQQISEINISNNRFINNIDCMIALNPMYPMNCPHHITIKNNLIANNGYLHWIMRCHTHHSNIKFIHNTIANNNRSFAYGSFIAIVHPGNIDFQNNLFSNPNSNTINFFMGHHPVVGKVHKIQNNNFDEPYADSALRSIISGNISVSPLFVNANKSDYHLSAASPCINAGIVVSGVDKDIDQNDRDWSPDIGCDEFAPHIYFTGTFEPFSRDIELNLIGPPGQIFGFVFGHQLNSAINTPFGLLRIDPMNMTTTLNMGNFNSSGHFSVRAPVGYAIDISVQGLINNTLTENAARLLID